MGGPYCTLAPAIAEHAAACRKQSTHPFKKHPFPLLRGKDTDHLEQEELEIPKAIRKYGITKEQNTEAENEIMASIDAHTIQFTLPSVRVAGQDWMENDYWETFVSLIPPVMQNLFKTTLLPNYYNVYCQLRDAPLLETEPDWSVELPFDMSMLAPPPAVEEAATAA